MQFQKQNPTIHTLILDHYIEDLISRCLSPTGDKVALDHTDTCWLWQGSAPVPKNSSKPYARIRIHGLPFDPAHVLYSYIHNSPIPNRSSHICPNLKEGHLDGHPCINPHHRSIGSTPFAQGEHSLVNIPQNRPRNVLTVLKRIEKLDNLNLPEQNTLIELRRAIATAPDPFHVVSLFLQAIPLDPILDTPAPSSPPKTLSPTGDKPLPPLPDWVKEVLPYLDYLNSLDILACPFLNHYTYRIVARVITEAEWEANYPWELLATKLDQIASFYATLESAQPQEDQPVVIPDWFRSLGIRLILQTWLFFGSARGSGPDQVDVIEYIITDETWSWLKQLCQVETLAWLKEHDWL